MKRTRGDAPRLPAPVDHAKVAAAGNQFAMQFAKDLPAGSRPGWAAMMKDFLTAMKQVAQRAHEECVSRFSSLPREEQERYEPPGPYTMSRLFFSIQHIEIYCLYTAIEIDRQLREI